MARRLLLCGAMLALASSTTGCIVPVPLEQAPPQVDGQPVILVDQASPKFGPVSRGKEDPFEFSFVAEDPDLGDVLLARLMKPGGSDGRLLISEITLAATGDPNLTRRAGAFENTWCDFLNLVGTIDIWVRVSDRPFSSDPATPEVTDGDFDEKVWELTCSA